MYTNMADDLIMIHNLTPAIIFNVWQSAIFKFVLYMVINWLKAVVHAERSVG